jgi:tetratricopeptide (TPR) repeat protein
VRRASRSRDVAVIALLAVAAPVAAQPAADDDAVPATPVARYLTQLERMGLVDVDTGDRRTLEAELAAAEALLRDGDPIDAAVALYAIVETPRYAAFTDFVEYQNAEYDLAVALAGARAYGAALDVLDRVLARGPTASYWGPAHRRAVDIALDMRDHAGVLARLEAIPTTAPIPAAAAGERAYLRGRAAYAAGRFDDAERELASVSRRSRLYSSALYLRGVMQARRGQLRDAAAAFCEIADTPDTDRFTFVVDDRYFTIKDLARLGLGRIAHEQGEYDDAYYHYFQIPEDSTYLGDALFEASWSMYQKRELATARDLVGEMLAAFPSSPLWPEANLLAGYVELADCRFDEAQAWYDGVVSRLGPVIGELDRIRKDPDARARLFDRALTRWRDERADGASAAVHAPRDVADQALGLLRVDPEYVRLHDAISGMRRAAGEAPGVVRAWSALARRIADDRVGAISAEASAEVEDARAAGAVADDLAQLAEKVARARADLDRGRRTGAIDRDVARDEARRLADLARRFDAAAARARAVAASEDASAAAATDPSLGPLLAADLAAARRLDARAQALLGRLEAAADRHAQAAIDRLYRDTKRVSDKAKLGKIDAVIGQKQALDIRVQDLAQGRFPAELRGRLWSEGMIGDDEEVWPFEGEYWADEYESWR